LNIANTRLRPRNEESVSEPTMTWDEWKAEFRKVCDRYDYPDLLIDCGESCWREYYDEGETPEGAFVEDMSN
jgi:hypothetical protein